MIGNPSFREVQSLHQNRISWVVYFGAAVVWYGFIQQIFFGQPFGTNPGPNWLMWLLWVFIGLGMPILWLVSRLIVEVYQSYLYIRFLPFTSRQVLFSDIQRVEARTYRPIRDYGGWGVRQWGGNKLAYNVKGNRGVKLELYNGQTILIGSQQAEDLANAIIQQMT